VSKENFKELCIELHCWAEGDGCLNEELGSMSVELLDSLIAYGKNKGRKEVKGLRDEERGEIWQKGYDKRNKVDVRFAVSMGGGMFFGSIGNYFGYEFNLIIIGLGMLFGWWVSK